MVPARAHARTRPVAWVASVSAESSSSLRKQSRSKHGAAASQAGQEPEQPKKSEFFSPSFLFSRENTKRQNHLEDAIIELKKSFKF